MAINNLGKGIDKMVATNNLREQRLNDIWAKYDAAPLHKKKHFDIEIGKEYDPFDFDTEYAMENWQPQTKDYFYKYANHYGMFDDKDEKVNTENYDRWLSYLD